MKDNVDIAAAVSQQTELRSAHFRISINPDDWDFDDVVTEQHWQKSSLGVHGKVIAFPGHRPENVRFLKFEFVPQFLLLHAINNFNNRVKYPVHNTLHQC